MPSIHLRIRQVSAAGLVLVCGLAAAAAQSPLQTQPNQKEKQKLAGQIAAEGLNCPVVGVRRRRRQGRARHHDPYPLPFPERFRELGRPRHRRQGRRRASLRGLVRALPRGADRTRARTALTQTCYSCRGMPDTPNMRNGLYSIHIQMGDGVKGRASGVLMLRDGRFLGGDPYFWSRGTLHVQGGQLEGRSGHQPAHPLSRPDGAAGFWRPGGHDRLFRNLAGRPFRGFRHLAGGQPQRQFSCDIAPAGRLIDGVPARAAVNRSPSRRGALCCPRAKADNPITQTKATRPFQ